MTEIFIQRGCERKVGQIPRLFETAAIKIHKDLFFHP
jgi:hypothetical protein